MARRTPRQAAAEFRDALRQSLSCISDYNYLIVHGTEPGQWHMVVLPNDVAVPLRASQPLELRVRQHVEIVPTADRGRYQWSVRVRGYQYSLFGTGEAELLSYHWHPAPGLFPDPHVHVAGHDRVHRRMHLPTGLVAAEDVFMLAIREFGARPLRDDWQEILLANREREWWQP